MKRTLAHVGQAALMAIAIAACGSESSRQTGGKGEKQDQGKGENDQVVPPTSDQNQVPPKGNQGQKSDQQQQFPPAQQQAKDEHVMPKDGKPAPQPPKAGQQSPKGEQAQAPIPGPNPGQQFPIPNPGQGGHFPPVPGQDGGGFQYAPITHLNICLNAEPSAQLPRGTQVCTGMFGADGAQHFSQINIGDNQADLNSLGVSVTAMSVPGAAPITALDLCINAEGSDNRCTGYQQFADGIEYSTQNAVGDGQGDIVNAAISAKAFYAPNALPITRINICVAGEERFVCTGDAVADNVTRTSGFSIGDGQRDLNNIALKFFSLSY